MYGRYKLPDPSLIPFIYAGVLSLLSSLFGFEVGMLFGNQEEVAEFFIEATNRSSVIMGTFVLGFVFGVFIAGYISYGSGRKISVLSGSVLGNLAVLSLIVAPGFTVLLCGYFVLGFSFGMYIVSVLMYICETVLPEHRSVAAMMPCICTAAGAEISLFVESVRSVQGVTAYASFIICNMLIITFALIKIPESPRHLAMSGSTDAALSVLFRLRHDMGAAARELSEINECSRGENRGFELFLQDNVYRQLLAVLCICLIMFSLSGFFTIPYMTVDRLSYRIICDSDFCYFDVNRPVLIAGFTAILTGMIFHTAAMFYFGRKKTLISATSLGSASLFVSTISSVMTESTLQSLLLVSSLIAFSFFSSGAVTAFLCSVTVELMPIRGREFGVSAVCLCLGLSVLFSLHMNRPLLNMLEFPGYFLTCTLASTVLCYLIYTFIPDNTGRMSLEEIEMFITPADSVYELTDHHEEENNFRRNR